MSKSNQLNKQKYVKAEEIVVKKNNGDSDINYNYKQKREKDKKETEKEQKEILDRQKELEKFCRQSYIIYEPRVLDSNNKPSIITNNSRKNANELSNIKGETIYVNQPNKITNSKSSFTLSSSKYKLVINQ